MSNLSVKDKIVGSRMLVYNKSPFFAVLMANATIVETKSIPTAATDGRCIYYNHDFFDKLSKKEVAGVMLHEVLHMALGHVVRINRMPNKQKGNLAADYVVNPLVHESFGKEYLPECALYKEEYELLSMEEIYDLIPDNEVPKQVQICLRPDLGEGEGEEGETVTPQELGLSEEEWKQVLDQAMLAHEIAQGKEAGNQTKGLDAFIKQRRETVIPWHQLIEDYLQKSVDDHIDWSLPDRRWLGIRPNFYMERLDGHKVTVHVYLDTSGSVSDDVLSAFLSEVRALAARKSVTLRLYEFDTNVYPHGDIESDKIKGRGGTDFNCILDHLNPDSESRNDEMMGLYEVDLAIIMTDGYSDYRKALREVITTPIIWIIDTPVDYRHFVENFPDEICSKYTVLDNDR